MRVNIYAEEMSDRVELVEKNGHTGVRFYLYLPVTMNEQTNHQVRGPFIHGPDDDDTAAVTFWGKRELRAALVKALELLDANVPLFAQRPHVPPALPLADNLQPRERLRQTLDTLPK